MKHPTAHILAGLLAAGVLIAGCGGSSSGASSGHPGSATPGDAKKFEQQFITFASCMRSHGVPNYPDPQFTGSGGVRISPGQANPNSPAFKTADSDCHRLLPNGGAPAGANSPQDQVRAVKYADCMRAHGVPNFPDPSHDGAFNLPPGLNPESPQFSQAGRACQSVQPSSLSVNQSADT
jgi:hypothetical protein